MKDKILRNKTAVIVVGALVVAAIGFGAGMLVKTSVANSGGNYIGIESAKQIALENVGVSASKATFTKAELDRDSNVDNYDIEFYTTALEYEFEIDATKGNIIEKNTEQLAGHDAGSAPAPNQETNDTGNTESTPNSGTASEYIGISKAKEIALQHAGVTASNATMTKSKLDSDDGIKTYEIEFITNNTEYDYEINAKTGKILEYDRETHQDYNQDHNYDD